MKLVNNTLLAFKAEGLASSVAVADGLGLDTSSVIEALGGGPLLSPWDTAKLQRIAKYATRRSCWCSRSRTPISPSRLWMRAASNPLPPSPTSGNAPLIADSEAKTSLS